jgi:tRNA (mo5U34)-methyltransferase
LKSASVASETPNHFLSDYPALKWRSFEHAIPRDRRGKSVLDIGCNAGFYSMELKRRGADRVLGIDFDEGYLAQARFAAEVSRLNIEFRRVSVYDVAKLHERFDIVLFMRALYHLRHPLLALDLPHEHVVKDVLVFQSLMRGPPGMRQLDEDYPFEETSIFDDPEFPRMYFIEQRYSEGTQCPMAGPASACSSRNAISTARIAPAVVEHVRQRRAAFVRGLQRRE